MANRTFIDANFSLIKRMVQLFATIEQAEAVTPVPILEKWNYGTFNSGPTIRTYTAAPTTPAVPTSAGNFPGQYQIGSEGVMTVVRTATGLWTVRVQDNYQRLVGLNAYQVAAAGTSIFMRVDENSTISNMTAAGGSIIGLAFSSSVGVAVDPIGTVRLHLTLQDASEG